MAKPLQGLLVVALEQALAAPLCTARLADAGARVIKIERADGDFARGYDSVAGGESAYFVWVNRGKESICLDTKNANDTALLHTMIADADIFIQNLAPGAAERAGLGSIALRKGNEKLITVDISGYGDSGPYRDMKAYDMLVQCESGLTSITGSAEGPGRVGISVCDIACGLTAHAAILEALLERAQTGKGKRLQISMFDALAEWMTVPLLHQEGTGRSPARVGVAHPSIQPYGAYPTADHSDVVIAIQNDREWRRFCEQVLQQPEFATRASYASNEARCANQEALNTIISAVTSACTELELRKNLADAGIAFASLNDMRSLSEHPQLRRVPTATPSGIAQLVAPAAQADGETFNPGRIPALDEHGAALRAEFSRSN